MKHMKPMRILGLVIAVGLVTFFSNCGKFANSKTYQAQKAATISTNAVFSTGGTATTNPPTVNNGDVRVPEPNEPNNPTPPPPPPPVIAPPTNMPIELYCSQDATSVIGSTLATSPTALLYGFKDASGAEICSFREEGARDDLINTSRINIKELAKKCPALKDGDYVMTLKSPNGGGSMLMTILNMAGWQNPSVNQAQYYGTGWIGHPLHVNAKIGADKGVTLKVTDLRPCDGVGNKFGAFGSCESLYGDLAAKVLSSTLTAYSTYPQGAKCAHGVSPLLVRLSETNKPITLSPPLSGIDFDIMGINAVPPHSPKRISWFTAETAKDDYFFVLPNERGEVLGIDQMFGDNTITPDGHKPPADWNGYAALGLHDGRRHDGSIVESLKDGFITPDDEVFSKLRLWHDVNHNGVAEPNELSTLVDHQIERIDLNFTDDFQQTDDYGNVTKMKSTVQTRDGKTHLMYDLWFRAL